MSLDCLIIFKNQYGIHRTPAVKLTRTAQKKAAKAARLEKRQQKASASGRTTPIPPSPISASESTPESASPPTQDTLLPDADPEPVVPPAPAIVDPTPAPEPVPAPAPPAETAAAPQAEKKPVSKVEQAPAPKPASTPIPQAASEEKKQVASVESTPAPKQSATESASESEQTKKRQNVVTRTLWTFIMIGGFISALISILHVSELTSTPALLLLGHAYMVLLVMLCQTAVYREVTALFSIKYIEGEDTSMAKDPWSKTLNWYFFAVANYYLYGESIIYYFKVSIFGSYNFSGPLTSL